MGIVHEGATRHSLVDPQISVLFAVPSHFLFKPRGIILVPVTPLHLPTNLVVMIHHILCCPYSGANGAGSDVHRGRTERHAESSRMVRTGSRPKGKLQNLQPIVCCKKCFCSGVDHQSSLHLGQRKPFHTVHFGCKQQQTKSELQNLQPIGLTSLLQENQGWS